MERFYGYGIVDKDGVAVCSIVELTGRNLADIHVDSLNAPDKDGIVGECSPFRVVSLYYKDEIAPVGPIPTLDEMRKLLNGEQS